MRRRLSIRTQLLGLVLAVALPSIGLVAWGIADAWLEARHAAYREVRALADDIAGKLDLILRDNESLLARIAQRPRVRALDPGNCDPLVEEFVALRPEYTTLALRDRNANAICSFIRGPLGAGRVGDFPWFVEGLRSEKFTVGDAFLGQQTGRWVSVLTHPVRDASQNVSGLLVLPRDLLALQERVLGALPGNAIAVVFDRKFNYLMRSIKPEEWIGKPLPRAQRDQLPPEGEQFFELTGVDGVTRLNAVAVVSVSGWRVYAALPKDVVFGRHRDRLVYGAGLGIAVLLLALALAYRIGTSIVRPIGDLARIASEMKPPGSPDGTSVKGAVEIEAIASQLDRLVGERDRQRGERAALAAHYEQLMKLARDIVLLVDVSGRIIEVNDAGVAAYGYSADELREMHVRDLRPPEAQAATERDWQAAGAKGGALFETVHRRRDGSTFPVEVSAHTIEVNGTPYRQAFVRNISERKQAEAARRMAEQDARHAYEQFEAIFLGAPEAMSISDLESGRLIVVNDAFCETFGYPREALIGRTSLELGLWTDSSRRATLIAALRTGQTVRGVEGQTRRRSGELREVLYSGEVIRLGGDARLLLMFTDITDRKRAEQKIRAQLDEMLRWQEIVVGREERMQQLKAEVNELLARQGQPERYSRQADS